jgi:hypothetical protein
VASVVLPEVKWRPNQEALRRFRCESRTRLRRASIALDCAERRFDSEREAHMPNTNPFAWPSMIIAADDDAPEGRHVVLTAIAMSELVRRLEPFGPHIAASVNGLQFADRPLLALEIKAGTSVPTFFRSIDGDDLTFLQGGLTWRPGDARVDGTSNVFILAQTLDAPRWLGASNFMVPPLTEHNTLFYVVTLPAGVDDSQPLYLRVLSAEDDLEIPPEVVSRPPHPVLWWGTPPDRNHG